MNSLVNKIALGTVQFGLDYGISNLNGKTSSKEVSKILDYAKKYGIDTLDTASAYGESESVLGKHHTDHFNIVSKFINVRTPSDLKKQLNNTLLALNQDKVYGYLAHRPEEIIKNKVLWETLLNFKREKKVLKIGFSLNTLKDVEALEKEYFIPDLIQVPYNYFDYRFENYIKDLKKKYGTEIHTRSTFLQGLFFINPEDLDQFFKPVLDELKRLRKNKYMVSQLLQFVLNKPFIDKVVIGVNNSDQLSQNLKSIFVNCDALTNIDIEIPERIITPSFWP